MTENHEEWYWYSSHGGMLLEQLGMPDSPPLKCRDCDHSCKVVLNDGTEHLVCCLDRDEGDRIYDLQEVSPDDICILEY